jgi:hypothetical protein
VDPRIRRLSSPHHRANREHLHIDLRIASAPFEATTDGRPLTDSTATYHSSVLNGSGPEFVTAPIPWPNQR